MGGRNILSCVLEHIRTVLFVLKILLYVGPLLGRYGLVSDPFQCEIEQKRRYQLVILDQCLDDTKYFLFRWRDWWIMGRWWVDIDIENIVQCIQFWQNALWDRPSPFRCWQFLVPMIDRLNIRWSPLSVFPYIQTTQSIIDHNKAVSSKPSK